MECSHINISIRRVKKEIFDSTFIAKTSVCNDCGAYLRDDEYEKKYMRWLGNIYAERRDKFQVQCHFSKNLIRCLDKCLEEYPGISTSVFMRALVTVYFGVIDRNRKKSSKLDDLLDPLVLDSFVSDRSRKKVSIQFKPKMMIDLLAISEFLKMSTSEVVERVIIKLMVVITSQDQKVRKFWESEIRSYLEMFLKAA